jgi:hypothetical protein
MFYIGMNVGRMGQMRYSGKVHLSLLRRLLHIFDSLTKLPYNPLAKIIESLMGMTVFYIDAEFL